MTPECIASTSSDDEIMYCDVDGKQKGDDIETSDNVVGGKERMNN